MKLAYQIATPDVRFSPGVTSYQGDLEHTFARAKECGYDGVELMVANPCEIDAGLLKELCAKYGLEIPMVCTGEVYGQDGYCFSDPDPDRRAEAIKRAKDAIDLAAEFGAQINVGRLKGYLHYGLPKEECIARSTDGFKEICKYANGKNVCVAIEPANSLVTNYLNTTQEGVALAKEIDEPSCTLMIDTNHIHISDKDMVQSVLDSKEYLTYVHLADSDRYYPGHCKFDFETFLKTLHEIGYDGWVSVEIFQRPDQDTALEKGAEYMRGLLAKLGY